MKISKWHGLGNDFILTELSKSSSFDIRGAVERLCDRHFGVGADGVVTIRHLSGNAFEMRIYNADGTEPEMCGNVTRCVGLYIKRRMLARGDEFELRTKGGIVRPKLQVRLNGGDWSSISIPVNVATRIADGAYPAEPQFTLDSRANLVSQMEHNPYTAHRVWSGPEDQSVRIFLASDDTELKFRVEVTDDVHVKSPGAASSFMEDGIQLALAVPGQNGHWEFGFAELEDGSPGTHCWIRPDNLAEPRTKLAVSARGRGTIYEIAIPLAGIGAAPEQLKRGIQFNLLVNDNDGEGRDGWMQIAPGIGEAKNPELYPFILK